jgi:hypothetical protein
MGLDQGGRKGDDRQAWVNSGSKGGIEPRLAQVRSSSEIGHRRTAILQMMRTRISMGRFAVSGRGKEINGNGL